jgi:PAS domain S-box-containing protein
MEEIVHYPIKIIYAEDNPLDVDLTIQAFKNLKDKFDFEFVMTGKELIEKIKEKSYDIILLDNHLPDVEGVDLIQKISSLNIKTPIVIITGLGDDELVLKAIKFGAVDYIPKIGDYLEKLPHYLQRIYELSKSVKHPRYHVRLEEIKLLYIEHDLQDIELLERYILREYPHIKVKSITSSTDALKLLEEENFDLILIDLRMPDIDGIEFTRRLKEFQKEIPIIIITGKGDEKSAIEALKLGVYDYVNKDIDYIEKLPRIIETSYLRYKYDKSILNHEKKYLELTITLEQQFQERTISLIQEIERRKESELKYRELYLLFENFLNTLTDLVVVKDKDFKIIFVNKQWEKFFGFNIDTFENGSKSKIYLTFKSQNSKYDLIAKETCKPYKDLIKVSDPAGIERIFEVIVSPILNVENEFDGVISLYRDITEHIELQDALKKSEEKYRSFISNSTEMIACFEFGEPIDINLTLDEQINAIYKSGKLSECNNVFLETHKFSSLEEALHRNFGFFYPIISENNRRMLTSFIKNNYSIKNFETQKLMPDGTISYFSESITGII